MSSTFHPAAGSPARSEASRARAIVLLVATTLLHSTGSLASSLAHVDLFLPNETELTKIGGNSRWEKALALLAEGSKVKDPAAFARRINELMVKDFSQG